MAVHERKALEHLEDDVADARFGKELLAVLHAVVEICVHELEDKEELVRLADHLFELDDVWVAELLE